jgi:hypothetical protein
VRTAEETAVANVAIRLMRGVVYRESDEDVWLALDRHAAAVRDHFAAIGVDVVVDETEGYAYLRTREDDDADPLPRLVKRRALTYNVSLLLVLLRKRLAEWETSGGEGQLVLHRDQLVDLLRLFLADSTNGHASSTRSTPRSRRPPSSAFSARCVARPTTGRCGASSRPTSTPRQCPTSPASCGSTPGRNRPRRTLKTENN